MSQPTRIHHHPQGDHPTLTDEERAAKLEQAAALIDEVVRSLDLRHTTCDHCSRATYTNWTQYITGTSLKGTLEKLRGAITKLRRQRNESPTADELRQWSKPEIVKRLAAIRGVGSADVPEGADSKEDLIATLLREMEEAGS